MYIYIYIYIYIHILTGIKYNCYTTAENCQIIHVFLKTFGERSQQSLFPLLHFHLHWEKFVCAKHIRKIHFMLQSYYIGCPLANGNTKNPIVVEIHLIAKSALTGY